jgi:hypothetical protein
MTIDQINAKLDAANAPLFVTQGPRAVKWFKVYGYDRANSRSGYRISKSEARNILFGFGLYDLAA